MTCEHCQHELQIGEYPFCPHGFATLKVVGDDIPGGVLIEHGLCNPDGSPRRYYSKSEMAREAEKRGLVNVVRHIDGSPHTTRWV